MVVRVVVRSIDRRTEMRGKTFFLEEILPESLELEEKISAPFSVLYKW